MTDRALLLLIAAIVVLDNHHGHGVLANIAAAAVNVCFSAALTLMFIREVWRS